METTESTDVLACHVEQKDQQKIEKPRISISRPVTLVKIEVLGLGEDVVMQFCVFLVRNRIKPVSSPHPVYDGKDSYYSGQFTLEAAEKIKVWAEQNQISLDFPVPE